MLPLSGVRRRSAGISVSEGMNRLSSVMNDSARRYRRLPTAGKIVFCLSLVFSILLYGFLMRYLLKHDITDDHFLEVPSCPACFGSSGCGLIYYNQIQLSGWANYRFSELVNFKNVREATLSGSQRVILKQLGSSHDLQKLDDKVCKDASRPAGCDVGKVLFMTDVSVALRKEPLQPKHLKQSAGMFTCASYRLMDRMWTYYKELRRKNSILIGDKLQVWYTASLNPEPLLLQTFPASERWPFPEYYGACGRHVIMEHVGRTLDEMYDEPFHKRAGIAYELLKIAKHLTDNDEDFALYLTDPSWENFGVDAAGKVRILDAENIIVVDKLAIEAKKPRGYDRFIESDNKLCSDSSCLSFVPYSLCSHLHSDHNYYAICTNLLDLQITHGNMKGGLLHDMPEEAKDFWDLENLLNECARPSKPKGRILVKDKLLSALAKLHDQSEDHLAPPPAIDPDNIPVIKPKKELWEYDDYDDNEVNDEESKKGVGGKVLDKNKDIPEIVGKGAVKIE